MSNKPALDLPAYPSATYYQESPTNPSLKKKGHRSLKPVGMHQKLKEGREFLKQGEQLLTKIEKIFYSAKELLKEEEQLLGNIQESSCNRNGLQTSEMLKIENVLQMRGEALEQEEQQLRSIEKNLCSSRKFLKQQNQLLQSNRKDSQLLGLKIEQIKGIKEFLNQEEQLLDEMQKSPYSRDFLELEKKLLQNLQHMKKLEMEKPSLNNRQEGREPELRERPLNTRRQDTSCNKAVLVAFTVMVLSFVIFNAP